VKEAVLFTQHRYASESVFRTLKLGLPGVLSFGADWLTRNKTFGSIPHLGARIISSELRARGYRVRIADLFDDRVLKDSINLQALVCISAMDIATDRVVNMLGQVHGKSPVLLGGYGITASAERFSNFPRTSIIKGEGEELVGQAVEDIEGHGYGELFYQRTSRWEMANFETHPSMDQKFSCLDYPMFQSTPLKVIEVSRGCFESCDFCPTAGYKPRIMPLSIVQKQIEQMKLKPWDILFFVDQNLMVCPQDYLLELFKFTNKKGIKWIGEGTISRCLSNPKLLEEMAKNCLTFLVGIEDLFYPTRGSATKNELRRHVNEMVKTCRENKLPVVYSMIFGTDNQKSDVFCRAADEINRMGLTVSAHIATPRPGTPYYSRVVSEGRLINPASIDRNMRTDAVHNPKFMSRDTLLKGFAEFQKKVYSINGVGKRFAKNFIDCGLKYALGLLVTDLVYMTSTWKYLKRHEHLLK
jgi:radical SAM superfamily enzyme YgiQ (UPF0313 family)